MPEATTVTPDLMSVIYKQITPETIRAIASQLGEDGERTASAVSAGVPSVLTALSDVTRSDTGAGHLKEIIDEKRGQRVEGAAALLNVTGANGHGGHELSLLDDELGQRSWAISDAVASTSGIRRESAHKLLGGVTSLAVLAVAKSAGNLSPGGLRSLFNAQRAEWLKRLPTSMASAFDPAAAGRPVVTTTEPARIVTGTAIRELERPKRSWLLPALLAAALLLFIPLLRGARHRVVPVRDVVVHTLPAPVPHAIVPVTPKAALPMAPAPAPEVFAVRGAPLTDLAAFLAGSEGTTPRRFALPPLGFDTGAVEPGADAAPTIKQVADLLAAHSSATIRVESFTDNVGSAEDNLDLSRRRSEAVKALLVDDGADAARIEVNGLGQSRPIASNATEEGRRLNRRTDLVVTQR